MKEKRQGGAHLVEHPAKEKREKVNSPKGKKHGVGRSVLFVLLALVVVELVAAVLFVNSKLNLLNFSDGKTKGELSADQRTVIDTTGLDKWEAPKLSESELAHDDGIFNILLLGTDGLELEYVDSARADAIILVSLDLKNGEAKLTSFQRGIGMPITSGEYEGLYDLITHIFAHGGADMVMEDIRECFKVNVDRYVRVNFNSLMKVIDVLGGVEVELTEHEVWYLNRQMHGESIGDYLDHGFIRGDAGSEEHDYVVGMNRLSGSMALAYSRLRAIDDDWHRIQRQRTVIQACANALKDADIATLNDLANEILPLVQTNLTKAEITELMLRAPAFLGVQFEQLSLPAEGSYGGMEGIYQQTMLAVDFDYNSKLLQEFIYGD